MKEKINIKTIQSLFPILGLAVLLLLSPCKIRNFIQEQLGVPQTEVLNKSQSTISQSNCVTFQTSKTIQTLSKPTFKQASLQISEYHTFECTTNLVKHSFISDTLRKQRVSNVPLYILYQNLKVNS